MQLTELRNLLHDSCEKSFGISTKFENVDMECNMGQRLRFANNVLKLSRKLGGLMDDLQIMRRASEKVEGTSIL